MLKKHQTGIIKIKDEEEKKKTPVDEPRRKKQKFELPLHQPNSIDNAKCRQESAHPLINSQYLDQYLDEGSFDYSRNSQAYFRNYDDSLFGLHQNQ